LFGIYGNYTEQQIQLIKDKLNSPISDTDTSASHAVTFHQNILFLDRIQQSLSPVDQMAAYSRSLSANAQYGHYIVQKFTTARGSYLDPDDNFCRGTSPQHAYAALNTRIFCGSHSNHIDSCNDHTHTSRQQRQSGTLSYCYVHGYGGHAGTKCREMLKDPKTYDHQHLIAATHTAVAGGSTWHN
jgi:hypothetical protein